jgi:hypothetical protein
VASGERQQDDIDRQVRRSRPPGGH